MTGVAAESARKAQLSDKTPSCDRTHLLRAIVSLWSSAVVLVEEGLDAPISPTQARMALTTT
eukprot:2816286-Alexandrium_andersonii.AAC.1